MGYCTVLGSIRAFDAEGEELALASEPQRRLLAILCLHACSVVRSTVLEEHLGLSAGALRTSISRLRRVIGPDVLVTGSAGYELRVGRDVDEFERLVDRAHVVDDEQARQDLDRACRLWAGSPFDEFAHEPWAEVEVHRLRELHASALEELASVLLDAGENASALVALVPLIDEHPYRDLPRCLLMRALSQDGRTTEALREFQTYRAVLRDDIGTEPSQGCAELDRAIASGVDLGTLRDAGHPAWARRAGSQPSQRPDVHVSLPTPLSSFVGRDSEIARVVDLLQDHRVVTLAGAGGSGKSRLALRVISAALARENSFAWWIDLGVLAADGDVAEQIATEIGVVPRRDPVAELERRLRAKRSLLILDNAEHVIDTTAEVITAILTRCPGTRALVTSREPLGVPGEVVWRVSGLGLPNRAKRVTLDDLEDYDALRLFVTRAREARPGMAIDRAAVEQIVSVCRELDGMPLGLELAAARLRTLPLESVATGINEVMRWKANTRRAPLARHATLRASIEWSFQLIDADEQRMLLALAVFRSPFDSEAARVVAEAIDPGVHPSELIQRLTDIGLLHLDDDSGRYRMLHTVRQFCLEHAAESGVLARAERAHAHFIAGWCEEVGDGERGIEHRPFVRRMPDVVAAWTWARAHDRHVAFRICRGLAPVRSALGQAGDFDATWRWLLDVDVDQRDEAWAESVAGFLTTATTLLVDTAPAQAQLDDFLPAGPSRARLWLERSRAMAPAFAGRTAQIQAYVDGLLRRGEDLEGSVYVGFAAYTLALMGRLDECDALLGELRRLTRRHGTTFSIDSVGNGYAGAIVAETVRGDLARALGRSRRPVPTDPAFSITSAAALAHAALLTSDQATMGRALEWATHGSFPLLEYLTPFTACCAALLDGASDEAADFAEDFWEQSAAVPVWRVYAVTLVGAALIGVGRVDAAESITEQCAELVADMESVPLLTASLHLAGGQIALDGNDLDRAEDEARAALEVAHDHGLRIAAVDGLEVASTVARRRGDHGRSRELGEHAIVERSRLGYRFRSATTAS
ncbi:BTAD domain-containing putative transcriptional regulator [Ilumatobacter sp.]|uniref:BTAD domain-containing putative transcriptional regulator n=1 Tax=Ilumatobacter sp. TaxID=1967498 RepID=UPI003C39A144